MLGRPRDAGGTRSTDSGATPSRDAGTTRSSDVGGASTGEARPRPDASDRDRSVVTTPSFRLGRLLFGGILAFMALDNLRNLDERVQYAESKGAPSPDLAVPGASAGLLLGSLGVALWRLPSLSAAAIAGFFVSVTPIMHDFWNVEDPEGRQQQLVHFLKNTALLGATLLLLRLGRRRDR